MTDTAAQYGALFAANATARQTLTAEQYRRVDTHAVSALWYAWGQLDSGALSTRDLDHGFRFAEVCESHCIAFVTEQAHMMPSVLDEWRDYLAANGITRH